MSRRPRIQTDDPLHNLPKPEDLSGNLDEWGISPGGRGGIFSPSPSGGISSGGAFPNAGSGPSSATVSADPVGGAQVIESQPVFTNNNPGFPNIGTGTSSASNQAGQQNQGGSGETGILDGILKYIGLGGGTWLAGSIAEWLTRKTWGSAGDQAREYYEDFLPELQPWEWGNQGSGFAEGQGGMLSRQQMANQLKIAEIEYRKAIDTAEITAAPPGEMARLAGERMPHDIANLQAQSQQAQAAAFADQARVELLASQTDNEKAQFVLNDIRAEMAEQIVKGELDNLRAGTLWTSLLNIRHFNSEYWDYSKELMGDARDLAGDAAGTARDAARGGAQALYQKFNEWANRVAEAYKDLDDKARNTRIELPKIPGIEGLFQ